MARDFSKNVSNYFTLGSAAIGPLINGCSAVTIACWVQPDTLAGASTLGDDICNFQNAGGAAVFGTLCSNTTATNGCTQFGGRRTSGSSRASRDGSSGFSTGSWQHFAAVMTFNSSYPSVYKNGVLNNGTGQVLTDSGVYVHSAVSSHDGIGATLGASGPSSGTPRMVDGRIAEFSIWSSALNDDQILSLGGGCNPRRVSPQTLVAYWKLNGQGSPEIEIINGKSGTIVGSIPVADHPRIF